MDQATKLMLQTELGLLPQDQLAAFNRRFEWLQTARKDQLPPEEYFAWLLLGGRGSGKTRAGAEDTWWPAYLEPQRVAVLGPTNNDVRKTCFEGESGLLSRIPKELVLNYNRTSLELWTKTMSGETSYFIGYSAEEPERLRGPQHHRAWCDELAAWKNGIDTWDMLMFGMRLGKHPTTIVTTTPKPTALLKQIMDSSDTVRSSASTFANAEHLPDSTLRRLREKYEGTRLGKQELYAELLEDVVGGLWRDEDILYSPSHGYPADPGELRSQMARIVVAVDPSGAGKDHEAGDSIGIVVAGEHEDGTFHTLADRTIFGGPDEWAKQAVKAYHDFQADRLVAESNFGGAMVEATIRTVDRDIPYRAVKASRGKTIRAEPISALYEQHRVYHVKGLDKLETQMLHMTTAGYVGSGSPDRVDALVWAMTDLIGNKRKTPELTILGDKQENYARI